MATLQANTPAATACGATPTDIAPTHWRESMLRGYFAVKRLCVEFDLGNIPGFFNTCMASFAQAYRAARKGSQARNVPVLAAVSTYRTAMALGAPISKSALIRYLPEGKTLASFHAVMTATAPYSLRVDARVITGRLIRVIISRLDAPPVIVDKVAQIMSGAFDAFLLTKPPVNAAAIVAAASLATGQVSQLSMTRVAAAARVAISAVNRCLSCAARRLGHPLSSTPVKSAEAFHALFGEFFTPAS